HLLSFFHSNSAFCIYFFFFFFNDTATTEIYTLSLHDALPICFRPQIPVRNAALVPLRQALGDLHRAVKGVVRIEHAAAQALDPEDRKSTRLNSSHRTISYAVFCLKKKKK